MNRKWFAEAKKDIEKNKDNIPQLCALSMAVAELRSRIEHQKINLQENENERG